VIKEKIFEAKRWIRKKQFNKIDLAVPEHRYALYLYSHLPGIYTIANEKRTYASIEFKGFSDIPQKDNHIQTGYKVHFFGYNPDFDIFIMDYEDFGKRMVRISGNTYPIKDQLKESGFKWNNTEKYWEKSY